ncbi:MAG: nickel pincer cofactor biosynthesis protein LarB [Planctomycetes bacterium]|nr:nickel pincer cofactor biosynthesis protein LarB [Planctomycetota bacterium]
MNAAREILAQLQAGAIDVDTALRSLPLQPATDLGFARIDHERASRCGFPEVVFCPGKTPAQAAAIATEILTRSERVLLTRADQGHADAVTAAVPDSRWHASARCLTVHRGRKEPIGLVAVVAAGTADLPVAEEAAVTLEIADNRVERHFDVGVAGLHRLLDRLPAIRRAHAVVAIAGMEGALPSVLAGLLARPVFAVPTSVGYGASFGGLTALLAMLNSCAAGVAVVNVDNGFGAGYLASLVNRQTRCPDPDDAEMTPR